MNLQVVSGKVAWIITYPFPSHHNYGVRLWDDGKIIQVCGQTIIPGVPGTTQVVSQEALISYVHNAPHPIEVRLTVDRQDPHTAIRAEFAESVKKLPPLETVGSSSVAEGAQG